VCQLFIQLFFCSSYLSSKLSQLVVAVNCVPVGEAAAAWWGYSCLCQLLQKKQLIVLKAVTADKS
jgi:hypothetical protein